MSLEPLEVLLAEDDEGDVRFVQECMKRSPYAVSLSVVPDGEKAVQYLRKSGTYQSASRPHLVFLDLNMPVMDGREAISHIKADAALKNIPIIVFTTSEQKADLIKLYALGANCYVTKPMEFDNFCRVIQEILHFWHSVAKLPGWQFQGRI